MYLFNVGVTDVKGLHHPTVVALQLGHGLLRNQVVGAIWQNAHEWLRGNLMGITTALLAMRIPLDLRLELSLPEACYAPTSFSILAGPNWEEPFGRLGKATHAFPRYQHREVSFARDLSNRSFFKGVADGDKGMFTGVTNGMGGGTATLKRGPGKVTSDACSFHKGNAIEVMLVCSIKKTQLLRAARGEAAWDKKHPLGYLLKGSATRVYQREFADFLDDVMQHDALPVTQGCWLFVSKKGSLMGMPASDLCHVDLHHHPVTGIQGHHGRSTQTHEKGDDSCALPHPLDTYVDGVRHGIEKGVPASANNVESRINKRMKTKTGCARRMVDLLPVIVDVASEVCAECAGNHQYSVLPDFFGECRSTSSRKSSTAGRAGKIKTGRNFRKMFRTAEDVARRFRAAEDNDEIRLQYHRHTDTHGLEAEYTIASDRTMTVARDMVRRNDAKHASDKNTNVDSLPKVMAILRDSWRDYMADPALYVESFGVEVQSWTLAQARDHMLDDTAFGKTSKHGEWLGEPTQAQAYILLETDLTFNNQAFQRIIPRVYLSKAQSEPFLREAWRKMLARDPWRTDVGFYECLHCNQYSKTKYCEHVAAVTLIEEVLEGVPGIMQHKQGVGTCFGTGKPAEKKNVYGQDVELSSPQKKRGSQRWSSQVAGRKSSPEARRRLANKKRARDQS